jgi:hypothetical protein
MTSELGYLRGGDRVESNPWRWAVGYSKNAKKVLKEITQSE